MVRSITIKSKEELAAIVEMVIAAEEQIIVLEVPVKSLFGRSILNFQLLKRESESAGKSVTISSENKEVLQMAADAGFKVEGDTAHIVNSPAAGAKSISDIVPPKVKEAREGFDEKEEAQGAAGKVFAVGKKLFSRKVDDVAIDEPTPETVEEEAQETGLDGLAEEQRDLEKQEQSIASNSFEGDVDLVDEFKVGEGSTDNVLDKEHEDDVEQSSVALGVKVIRNDSHEEREAAIAELFSASSRENDDDDMKVNEVYDPMEQGFLQKMSRFLKRAGSLVILAVIAIGMSYVAFGVLPKATIDVTMKRFEWEFNDAVEASTELSEPITDPLSVPLEIITLTKNIELDVPATGREDVSAKAKGTIIIYNEFSSDAQTLVATTRFLTPDNKLFRLDKAVTVPGAKIIDGRVQASSIEARVTADQPGEDFNIGPVERFSIPGFKGSPRYEGFYGASIETMSGGYIGETTVVTQEDLDSAREKASAALADSSQLELSEKVPPDFKTIEGLREIDFTELEFSHEVGDVGETVGVSADITLQTGYFREEDLVGMFRVMAEEALGFELEVRDSTIQYGVARIDFPNGSASFPVQFSANVARKVDVGELRNELAGKDATQTKSVIFGVPGLESANIKFWPIWIKSTPDEHEKIRINIK